MHWLAMLLGSWAIGFAVVASASPVNAQPGFPASFYGAVAVDGRPVPDGTSVRGYIDGVDCTQLGENYRTTITIDGVAQYAIDVVHESQKDGCGDEGKTVTFLVDGAPARETAEWRAGATKFDLNVGEGTGPTLAAPTPTATLEPSAAAATATEEAQFTPLTGTPPTDDVTLPGTTPGAASPGPPASGDDGGGGGILVLGLVVAGLLLIGAAGGLALARARKTGARP
jgi:hypothetical protein